jgi:hypothetical protein
MKKILAAAFTSSSVVFLSASAFADDGSAALGAGGIEFTKAADIRMAFEDLNISPDAVRIRYEFLNDSSRDIDTLVAFPLPDIDTWSFYEDPLGRTTNDPVNFVAFKVTVDGKPVTPQVEQRAIFRGKDVTGVVQAAGVPINIITDQNFEIIDKLAPGKKRNLENAGVAEREETDREHPKWTVRTRFYWEQHFPAGKTVVVEHSYKPVTGQAYFTQIDFKVKRGSHDDYWKSKYCMDNRALANAGAMLAARKASNRNGWMLNAYSTDFILKTANNWKGGIGKFHLTIDKLKPENVLSLCWDGDLKRTGPSTFETTRANFAPTQELKFVVLQ